MESPVSADDPQQQKSLPCKKSVLQLEHVAESSNRFVESPVSAGDPRQQKSFLGNEPVLRRARAGRGLNRFVELVLDDRAPLRSENRFVGLEIQAPAQSRAFGERRRATGFGEAFVGGRRFAFARRRRLPFVVVGRLDPVDDVLDPVRAVLVHEEETGFLDVEVGVLLRRPVGFVAVAGSRRVGSFVRLFVRFCFRGWLFFGPVQNLVEQFIPVGYPVDLLLLT